MFRARAAAVFMLVSGLMVPAPVLAEAASRIVSLGGSVTEIAVALGARDRLIGRDTTSNYPPQVTDLPDVGYIRALSPEGVLSLNPDLIISESGAGPVEALDVLRSAGVPFIEMPGEPTAQGVLDKIDAVAAALDLPDAGQALHDQTAAQLAKVQASTGKVASPLPVLYIITLQGDRIVAGGAGSAADGIINLAGGRNAAAEVQGFKEISPEAILTMAPELILIMGHGPDSPGLVDQVIAHPILGQTPAAKSGKVRHVDGMLTLGFGPRTAEAATMIHDALYGGQE